MTCCEKKDLDLWRVATGKTTSVQGCSEVELAILSVGLAG